MFRSLSASPAREWALAAAVGAGVLLGGAGLAEAETLSFFVERGGPEPVSASETMSFQQFNPALGILTGVTIRYIPDEADTFAYAGVAVIGGAGGSVTSTTSAQAALSVSASGLQLMSAQTDTASATCDLGQNLQPSNCTQADDSFGNTGVGPNPVQLSLPADLVPFEGTSTVDLIAELLPSFGNDGSVLVGEPAFDHYVSWGAAVEVTYQFQPVTAVPEPASLALLGSALGLAGLLGRRRRG